MAAASAGIALRSGSEFRVLAYRPCARCGQECQPSAAHLAHREWVVLSGKRGEQCKRNDSQASACNWPES